MPPLTSKRSLHNATISLINNPKKVQIMTNQPIIDSLKHVLADSYALSLKTQNYHWNVTGPHFSNLHALFEEHYNDLIQAIDEIAELIRGLGAKAPGTWKAYAAITQIKDGDENANAEAMVQELAQDQDVISQTLHVALQAAQTAEDEIVAGMLIDRLTVHRKQKWMLTSSL